MRFNYSIAFLYSSLYEAVETNKKEIEKYIQVLLNNKLQTTSETNR